MRSRPPSPCLPWRRPIGRGHRAERAVARPSQDHIRATGRCPIRGWPAAALASRGHGARVKPARPEARVVNIVGDGTFTFTAPDAVYQVAAAEGLPIRRSWTTAAGGEGCDLAASSAARTDRFLGTAGCRAPSAASRRGLAPSAPMPQNAAWRRRRLLDVSFHRAPLGGAEGGQPAADDRRRAAIGQEAGSLRLRWRGSGRGHRCLPVASCSMGTSAIGVAAAPARMTADGAEGVRLRRVAYAPRRYRSSHFPALPRPVRHLAPALTYLIVNDAEWW